MKYVTVSLLLKVGGMWVGCGWEVGERWVGCEWDVGGRWVGCG